MFFVFFKFLGVPLGGSNSGFQPLFEKQLTWAMGPWAYGPMRPWSHARGPMGPRAHEPMRPRARASMGPWASSPMGPRAHEPMGPWPRPTGPNEHSLQSDRTRLYPYLA